MSSRSTIARSKRHSSSRPIRQSDRLPRRSCRNVTSLQAPPVTPTLVRSIRRSNTTTPGTHQWRVGPTADVVVAFDRTPCRLVFWRGTSYVPHWVTENGIWYTNEFNETAGVHGCQEPMSDKQCRFSHVRIVESSDARVVVHWRYALVGNWYEFAHVDELTGWGDWSDEIYTIYPDGTGVRKITLHSSTPNEHEWHEGIVVMGPGQRPEDVLETDAVTDINEEGQFHNFSWLNGPPKSKREPPDANIQVVNTKSKFKPFLAFQSESSPNFQIYNAEVRRDVSIFPWWNHWPTAFDACDGRYAMDADRASHSAITHVYWNACEQTDDSMTKIMLNGVTNDSPEKLARLDTQLGLAAQALDRR